VWLSGDGERKESTTASGGRMNNGSCVNGGTRNVCGEEGQSLTHSWTAAYLLEDTPATFVTADPQNAMSSGFFLGQNGSSVLPNNFCLCCHITVISRHLSFKKYFFHINNGGNA